MEDLSYPKDIIEKLSQDFTESVIRHTSGTPYFERADLVIPIFLIMEAAYFIRMVNKSIGQKEAKKMRETICQRIHAYPLDEVKTNANRSH